MEPVDRHHAEMPTIDTDVLICGTGPAGASLACFLASYGIQGLVIGRTSSTAITPRAHCTNKGAFECLRDIGLEEDCRKLSSSIELCLYQRLCTSMAGEEISRAFMFGNDPMRHGDYVEASPCESADLTQTQLEPILLRYATQNGFRLRFDSEFITFTENEKTGMIESIVRDLGTGIDFLVRSRYLCGADGANSSIVQQLQLPLHTEPFQGLALNVFVEADLTHLMTHSMGLLHILTRPDRPQPHFGVIGIARFVEPFREWVFILLAAPGVTEIKATDSEIVARVEELIGDDSVKIKLKRISKWTINECFAKQYSRGNVFCLGDAVHRHPPHNGLGSNTCIQDSYNLAWKLAYVLQGRASPTILSTYHDERQPLGEYIVRRANDTRRLHSQLFSILGIFEPEIKDRVQTLAELREDSARGAARRAAFQKAIKELDVERDSIGAEMNQFYRSQAIYANDEIDAPPIPEDARAAALYYRQSTYPGSRLPHAWVSRPVVFGPRAAQVSTQDLAGHNRFTILTGIGGKSVWASAAAHASSVLGIDIAVYSIGWGQDYEDCLFRWVERRGVKEKGAVLVRPDRMVAWRSVESLPEHECKEKLLVVMRRILGVS